jgi:ribosomal protein L44E
MKAGPWVLGFLGFVFLLFIGIVLALGIIGILMILGAGAWAYSDAPKCPSCHWPWTLRQVSRKVVSQQRGFGVVTRSETHVGTIGNQSTSNVVQRQERAPTVTSTIRVDFVCRHCGKPAFKQFATTQEDFAPRPAQHAPQVVVNVNAPPTPKPQTFLHCRYCGALNPSENVGRAMHCLSCGATL